MSGRTRVRTRYRSFPGGVVIPAAATAAYLYNQKFTTGSTHLIDETGNGYDAKLEGSNTPYYDTALATTGTTVIPANFASAYTIYAEFIPDTVSTTDSGAHRVVSLQIGTSATRLALAVDDSKVVACYNGGSFTVSPGVAVSIGDHVRALIRYTGTNLRLYVNGALVDDIDVTLLALDSEAISIGHSNILSAPLYNRVFDGKIFNLQFYDEPLSLDECLSLTANGVPPVEPYRWYPCAEGSGTNCYDVMGSGDGLTLSAAVTWQTQDVFHYNLFHGFRDVSSVLIPAGYNTGLAAEGSALTEPATDGKKLNSAETSVDFTDDGNNVIYFDYAEFNGTTSLIEVADDPSLDISNNLSVHVRAQNDKSNITNTAEVLIAKYDISSNRREWRVDFTDAERLRVNFGDPSDGTFEATRITTAAVSVEDVQSYGFTFSSGTVVIYVNGVEVASSTSFGTLPSTLYNGTARLTVGCDLNAATPTNYFDGKIYEAAVYEGASTVLTAAQMLALHNGGLQDFSGQTTVMSHSYNGDAVDISGSGNDGTGTDVTYNSTALPTDYDIGETTVAEITKRVDGDDLEDRLTVYQHLPADASEMLYETEDLTLQFSLSSAANVQAFAVIPNADAGSSITFAISGDDTDSDTYNALGSNYENRGSQTHFENNSKNFALAAGDYVLTVSGSTTPVVIGVRRGDSRSGIVDQNGHSFHSFPAAIYDGSTLLLTHSEIATNRHFVSDGTSTYTTTDIANNAVDNDTQERYHASTAIVKTDDGYFAAGVTHNAQLIARYGTTLSNLQSGTDYEVSPDNRGATYVNLAHDPIDDSVWLHFRCSVGSVSGNQGGRVHQILDPTASWTNASADANNVSDRLHGVNRHYPRGIILDTADDGSRLCIFPFQYRPGNDWANLCILIFDPAVGDRGQYYNAVGDTVGLSTSAAGTDEANYRFTQTEIEDTIATSSGLSVRDGVTSNQVYAPGRPAVRIKEWNGSTKEAQTVWQYAYKGGAFSSYGDTDFRLIVQDGSTIIDADNDPFSLGVENYYRGPADSWFVGDDVYIAMCTRESRVPDNYDGVDKTPYYDMGGHIMHIYRIEDPMSASNKYDLSITKLIEFTANGYTDVSGQVLPVLSLQRIEGSDYEIAYHVGVNQYDQTQTQGEWRTYNFSPLVAANRIKHIANNSVFVSFGSYSIDLSAADAQVGDLVIGFFGASSAITIAAPSGGFVTDIVTGNNSMSMAAVYKYVTAADLSAGSISGTTNGAAIVAVTKRNAAVADISTAVDTTTSPTVTTETDYGMVLRCCIANSSGGGWTTTPTGIIRIDYDAGAREARLTEENRTSAGASGTATFEHADDTEAHIVIGLDRA